MNPAAVFLALGWLIRDTFRRATASGLTWVMLGTTAVCVVFCLGVSADGPPRPVLGPAERPEYVPPGYVDPAKAKTDGVDIARTRVSLLFGAFRYEANGYRDDTVGFLRLLLAGFVADALGVLLAMIWTAGFLPAFLDRATVSVLLAKPVPRTLLFAGQVGGVLLFVLTQATLFVAATWVALGIGTGDWNPAYWVCVPLVLVHFGVFYSFSALLAVATRSTAASAIGAVLFWCLCWAMNFGRVAAVGAPDPATAPLVWAAEVGYWVLPKPADLTYFLAEVLDTGRMFAERPEFRFAADRGKLSPVLSVVTSMAFAAVMFAIAAYEFETADY